MQNVFGQRPHVYLRYLASMVGMPQDHPTFAAYYEIAATRDLVVHNRLIVNELYIDKAKDLARGALGQRIVVDEKYFYRAIGDMKRVSGTITGVIEKKLGRVQPKSD